MPRELPVDRAIYLVDDDTRTYRFLRRNPDWRAVDLAVRHRNKQSIDGYTRIFPDGRTTVFRYRT